ncbi:glycoside hydrolase family 5 protein [Xylariaceae sp. FL1272]|nr:glycoside hydrolase family 5 protein [Xylariaceae sp. FL1272]
MAQYEDSDGAERRHKRSEAHRKKHKRRKSGDHGGTSRANQGLSMDALAQLNELNTRSDAPMPTYQRERERRHRSRPRHDEYDEIVVEEYNSPKRERRRKRESREPDSDYDTPRRHRRQESRDPDREYEPRRKSRRREGDYTDYESEPATPRRAKRQRAREQSDWEDEQEQTLRATEKRHKKRKSKRLVSGAIVEEGRATPGLRGGTGSKHSSYNSVEDEKLRNYKPPSYKKKKKWIIAGIALVVLIIIIIVAVVVSKKNNKLPTSAGGSSSSSAGDDVPTEAKGTYLDPSTWYDTTDFNTTYTNQTVGGLPIEGLMDDYDDSAQANDNVPALNDDWGDYSDTPARGVNLGGWLSLEPFITPSLFDYDSRLGIIDEYTLCSHLGVSTTASTLEQHYATFVTEETFKEIADAGLDHVRIPYSYWAVQTYDDDPYLFRTSWRYLLRGIEWARKYGLRVNLDLHGLPGSQNGWNHSGRQGVIDWLNGTNGDLNAQRSLDIHNRLSKFFAQDRYKNIIAFYGLANEPQMLALSSDVVINWTTTAYDLVKKNGLTQAKIVFGDGFMGLANWQGVMTGYDDLVLDAHMYVIFDNALIQYDHQKKITYACNDWSSQAEASIDTSTGYGPTMFAEWSQADTDCAKDLTNVGWGNRWLGTYNSGNTSSEATTPMCPNLDDTCDCVSANADPSDYTSEYKTFLLMFAEAQMYSFEKGWGWWYWTWDTEQATQWSYKKGLAAGILPAKAYEREFNCDSGDIPDFEADGLSESY